MGAPILWAPGVFAFCRKTSMPYRGRGILGFWGRGEGECRFYFRASMGAGIFLMGAQRPCSLFSSDWVRQTSPKARARFCGTPWNLPDLYRTPPGQLTVGTLWYKITENHFWAILREFAPSNSPGKKEFFKESRVNFIFLQTYLFQHEFLVSKNFASEGSAKNSRRQWLFPEFLRKLPWTQENFGKRLPESQHTSNSRCLGHHERHTTLDLVSTSCARRFFYEQLHPSCRGEATISCPGGPQVVPPPPPLLQNTFWPKDRKRQVGRGHPCITNRPALYRTPPCHMANI